ncbi:MAG: hypothetical protein FWE95_02120 [Planctomycetaceae bacterium]|nr:hypothetical protein [Planctomycetaceae bacterium]
MSTILPDHSLAIKRLARDLRILVCVQAVALGIFALGVLINNSGIVPDNPGWDTVHLLCRTLALVGAITFVIAAFWGVAKVAKVARPIVIRMYVWGFFLFFLSLLFPVLEPLIDFDEFISIHVLHFIFSALYIAFPFYSTIPQFFIARWLAKKAEDSTTRPEYVSVFTSPVTRRTCLTGCIVLAIIVAVLGLLLLGAFLIIRFTPIPPLVISEETTRFTGPLTDDGLIDFAKIVEERFYPPELATDENGYRVFYRLFGDAGYVERQRLVLDSQEFGYDEQPGDRESYRFQTCEILGLDPTIPPTMTLPQDPYDIIRDFYKAKGMEMPWREVDLNRPWTLEEYPMLADWLNEIDVPMDAIADAIRKPVFFMPLLQKPESFLLGEPRDLFALREGNNTRALYGTIPIIFVARAAYRVGQGDIDGAIDDKLTIHRYARLLAQNSSPTNVAMATNMERIAVEIPVNANPEHPLTEAQIRRILDELDALPPRVSLHGMIEWHRLMSLSYLQMFMRVLSSADQTRLPEAGINTAHGLNWNVVFRRVNEMYDAAQEPPPRTKLQSFQREPSKWDFLSVRILSPDGRAMLFTDAFIALSHAVFDLDIQERSAARVECMENMQRLALAILLYELEHCTVLNGNEPGTDWTVQIEKYLGDGILGDGAERYFSCPMHPTATGETRYALVQYGDTTGDTVGGSLMLVELPEAVPLDKAVITVEEVLEEFKHRKDRQRLNDDSHFRELHVVHRNGAVQFLSTYWTKEEELLQMLGRK